MKTTTDIASFLKRNDPPWLNIIYDGKVFIVKAGDMSARSQYLDDALENLAEETRRRASAMQPMRDKPAETKPQMASLKAMSTTLRSSQNIVWNLNYTPPPTPVPGQCTGCGAVTTAFCVCKAVAAAAQYPTCPNCGKFPRGGWGACPGGWTVDCDCSHQWNLLLTAGQLVRLGQFEYRFDGQNLISTGAILPP